MKKNKHTLTKQNKHTENKTEQKYVKFGTLDHYHYKL